MKDPEKLKTTGGKIFEQNGRTGSEPDQFLVHEFIILAAKHKVRLVTQAQQAFNPHRCDCRNFCCSL